MDASPGLSPVRLGPLKGDKGLLKSNKLFIKRVYEKSENEIFFKQKPVGC